MSGLWKTAQEALPGWNVALTAGAAIIAGNLAFRLLRNYSCSSKNSNCALDPEVYTKCKLLRVTKVSHNSAIYRFQLPTKVPLGLPIGRHIAIQATVGTRQAVRKYTPVSDPEAVGFFDLLIKTYPAGTISKYVSELKVGEYVDFKGPLGAFEYNSGAFNRLGMIAGGTGITPMYQVIKHALTTPGDKTKISLIYANVNEDDILLRKELEDLAAAHPDRFTIHYTLDNPPSQWAGSTGFVSASLIKDLLPAPGAKTKVLVCGPPPMVASMISHCVALGHAEDRVCRF